MIIQLFLSQGANTAGVEEKKIVISTEFFTSGQDSYELFAIDDLKKPLQLSKTFTMSSHTENESVRKDVNLEVFSLLKSNLRILTILVRF